MTAHGKTHAAYLALREQHPDWRDMDFAEALKVSRQRVWELKHLTTPPSLPANQAILPYLRDHPEMKAVDIATLFNVSRRYIAKLRYRHGIRGKAGRPSKVSKS